MEGVLHSNVIVFTLLWKYVFLEPHKKHELFLRKKNLEFPVLNLVVLKVTIRL